MSLAIVYSRARAGIEAPLVRVEVHVSNGLPALSIVGLPETEVRESKDRVRSALINSQFEFPTRRITINLAPADLPKGGARFDLAIALGVLAASGQIPADALEQTEFVAELGLDGELRPVSGVLPVALQTQRSTRSLIVAAPNAAEAALASNARVHGARHLLEVCAHLGGSRELPRQVYSAAGEIRTALPDLADVRGQHLAKRALTVAAAGGHSLLMSGPPGCGKSMLAQRLPGLLPLLEEQEALESAAIHSLSAQGFSSEHWRRRAFRAPHHTASAVALVGGGSQPRPGEISLAHHGVLFLDELPEFDRRVLEVLREPLESGRVVISRAARQAEFPAAFQLVAAMNPCPCGYLGDGSSRCRCTPDQIQRYRARISGPLLDRIDMHVEVPAVPRSALRGSRPEPARPCSRDVRTLVAETRERQRRRQTVLNCRLEGATLESHCGLLESDAALLEQAMQRLGLSARAYHRIQRVARTIADLAGESRISTAHLTEAIGYRCLDRPVGAA